MASNFKQSLAAFSVAGGKAELGLKLAQECVFHFYENSGNIGPARLAVEVAGNESDRHDLLTIFHTFLPIKVQGGEMRVVKGWVKKAPRPVMLTDGFTSFRAFAASLRLDPALDAGSDYHAAAGSAGR